MDVAFSAEQDSLRNDVRACLGEHCPGERVRALEAKGEAVSREIWNELGERGWLALGSAGGSLLDGVVWFEELGRAAVPGPFLATAEACLLLGELAAGNRRAAFASGREVASLALLEASGRLEPAAAELSAAREGDGFALRGRKLFVPWVERADALLVVGRLGSDVALFELPLPGERISVTPLPTLGGERMSEVRLEGAAAAGDARLGEGRDVADAVERAQDRAAILAAALLSGSAEAALACAVEHVGTREQFGKPLGTLQAVQHHCANMAMDVDAARLAVWDAAARVDAGEPPRLLASSAKAIASEAAQRVTATAQQLLGGAGYLADHALPVLTRSVRALESRLGNPDWHRERIAASLNLPG